MKTCQTCGGQIRGKYFQPCSEGIPEDDGNPGKCVQCGRPDVTAHVVPERVRSKSEHRQQKKEEVTSRASVTA